MGSTVNIEFNACNTQLACMKLAGSGPTTVPTGECNSGWHACESCSGTCESDDSFITKTLGSNAGAKLRGTEDIDESEFEIIVCSCGLTFDTDNDQVPPSQALTQEEQLRSPGPAPTSWKKVSRALGPRGCKR
jgi:hypothetical protein